MMPKPAGALLAVALLSGCAHRSLAAADLTGIAHPAFLSRIEEDAGPQATVFRDDDDWAAKLNKLDPKEGDRRLAAKVAKAMSRFELSDRLRATTLSLLPKEPPWSQAIDPARVANALESFLVDEVPANPPDYDLLKPLGADAVVEFVIERFGLRSRGGRAGIFLEGFGRMFRIGGGTFWRFPFRVDQVGSGVAALDPLKVAQDPETYRVEIQAILDAIAVQFAEELNPRGRAPAQ